MLVCVCDSGSGGDGVNVMSEAECQATAAAPGLVFPSHVQAGLMPPQVQVQPSCPSH